MASLLFEQLQNAGYLRGRKVNMEKISAAKPKDIVDLAEQSIELTSANALSREQSLFTHSASISLGGGRMPCGSPTCRLARARELAQFACLYSDKVYIHNFLQDFTSHPGHTRQLDPYWLRRHFATDLTVLAELRPIIEDGKLTVIGFPNACPSCLAQRGLSPDVRQRLASATKELQGRYFKEVTIDLEKRGGNYGLVARGSELLLNHGCQIWQSDELPPELSGMKRLMARVNSGETVRLTGNALKASKFDWRLATNIRKNVTFEFASSQALGSAFLTERELDIQMVEHLGSDPSMAQRNEMLHRHLTSFVPFIDAVDLELLLKLRRNEEDAFVQFRAALRHAVNEVRARKGRFTEAEAKELYADVVQPKLAQVDSKVRSAQRTLLRGTIGEVLALGGAITVGMLTGILTSDLAALASTLGLAKVAADIGNRITERSDTEKEARRDEMYFLWKVKQAASK